MYNKSAFTNSKPIVFTRDSAESLTYVPDMKKTRPARGAPLMARSTQATGVVRSTRVIVAAEPAWISHALAWLIRSRLHWSFRPTKPVHPVIFIRSVGLAPAGPSATCFADWLAGSTVTLTCV
jgi:hypothetical protein